MTETKKRRQRKSQNSWEDETTIIQDPFGSSALRRSVEQRIASLDENLKPILKEILPQQNYGKLRTSAAADIKEGTVFDESPWPIPGEKISSGANPPGIKIAIFAVYYTALADIENSSGNTENALNALIEANHLLGFIIGCRDVATEFKEEKRSSLGRPGGKIRQEMLRKITEEAARLLTELAPPEGWRFKAEATNAIQLPLDDFILKEGLGK